MKRPASQNERIRVLPMAFRARKVFGTFERHAPGRNIHKKWTNDPHLHNTTDWVRLGTAIENQDGGQNGTKWAKSFAGEPGTECGIFYP